MKPRLGRSLALWIIVTAFLIGPEAEAMPPRSPRDADTAIWAKLLVSCGGDYYYRHRGYTTQIRGATEHLSNDQSTAADRANGIQWTGSTTVTFSISRIYDDKQGWGDWENGPNDPLLTIYIQKRNGRWLYAGFLVSDNFQDDLIDIFSQGKTIDKIGDQRPSCGDPTTSYSTVHHHQQ
jgi:hypothetical protein